MKFHLVFTFALFLAACGGGSGGDGDGDCEEGASQCTGNTFERCEGGTFVTDELCTGLCDPGLGCIECRPGDMFCDTSNNVIACSDSGVVSGVVENCGDLTCVGGTCADLCGDAEANQSYIGCEYYAVDLDNAIETSSQSLFGPPVGGTRANPIVGCMFAPHPTALDLDVCVNDADTEIIAGLCENGGTCPASHTCTNETMCVLDAQGSPFAVVVSNPQAISIDVRIENGIGESVVVPIAVGEVKALFPKDLGLTEVTVDGSSQQIAAFKLSSTAPFVAYQFNPLDNEGVFSNDGSLLLPTHTWDSNYYAMTLPSLTRRDQPVSVNDYNGYITLVGVDTDTEVTVTPTCDVRPGVTLPAITAGTPTVLTLQPFEVLNLEAVGDGDLTGTSVNATDPAKSFGMFAGHEAVVVGEQCCADHIEEMMFPTSTWGAEFAIARSKPRGGEADTLRILAQVDNTVVSVSEGTCPTLMAGGFCEIEILGNVEISADNPIMVGHFLSSEGDDLNGQPGDPSMAIAVPTEQYRSTYSFLAPQEYDVQYISVVAPAGGSVSLDGNDITGQLSSIASGAYFGGAVQIQPGQHEVKCASKCGIEIYGYSSAVSYMFAGGLDLERIVID